MKNRTFAVLLSTVVAVSAPLLGADNWPSWRGPERNGVSRATDLPVGWSKTENVVWKVELPETSGSTPVVWEDHVFLSVADGSRLSLWAVSRSDGSVLWTRPLDDRNENKRKGNLSSPSPVTDGRAVWVMTGTGVLAAFDFTGEQLWQRDLQLDYGKFGILHGYSSSPLLVQDHLYVQVLHGFHTDDPSYVLAIESMTGRTKWRVERPTDAPKEAPDAYTTPNLLIGDGTSILVVSGADYVTGHDLETGREVWRVGGLNPTRNPMQRIVASPVIDETMIFVPSRVRPLLALSVKSSIREAPQVQWSMDRGPDVPTPVVYGPYVYLLNDQGIVWCLEKTTGDVVWGPERIASGTYSASPVVANGRLYATNEGGVTTVLETGTEFTVLGESSIDEYTLASLAVAHGQIFLRTAEHLYCIDDR